MVTRIAFRVDASGSIGTGHLRRCLSLAAALTARGAQVCFVLRRHDAVAEGLMVDAGYSASWLDAPDAPFVPGEDSPPHAVWAGVSWTRDAAETGAALRVFDPDWLVVDHYGLDARWHASVRATLGCSILVIDDLGDRPLNTDILLDANVATDHQAKYAGCLQRKTRMLVGPRYALLSPSYLSAPPYQFSSIVRSIGIFMGGTDPAGASVAVLRACRNDVGFRGPIEIVSTSVNPQLDTLREACIADSCATLSLDLPDLGAFYARHDLQIGAGGTSTYERCLIGAPSIALVLAANQLSVVPVLAAVKMLREAMLPEIPKTTLLAGAPHLSDVVRELIADSDARHELSVRGRAEVDARGAERSALAILAPPMTLRAATGDDGVLLHAWRNDPVTRSVSGKSDEIAITDHLRWLDALLANPLRALYVAEVAGQPVGSIRFDRLPNGMFEVSLYLDPGLHGLGLGRRMLLLGEIKTMEMQGGDIEFVATVLAGNDASARLFESCGYSGGPLRYTKSFSGNQKQS
ncbi:MAG: UDP-2,4-diacetamido-2,4,6-trideoxy-beta-L-altropyranose hydrolase [Burkholderiales bacterium]|nr:MAG: UDP-2,4-diacetamido-2,4,6-trideoxy-beta-L-altropyranose hydrolase [Burkholderiales bacterium]